MSEQPKQQWATPPADLGRQLDRRIAAQRRRFELDEEVPYGLAGPAAGGGGTGSSGGSSDMDPLTSVDSLRLTDGGSERDGALVLAAADPGTVSIAEDTAPSGDYRFTLTGKSLIIVASLPGTGDTEILYKRSSDDTLWWDADGAGSWVQLGAGGYWQRNSGILSPVTAGDDVRLNVNERLELESTSANEVKLLCRNPGDTYEQYRLYRNGTQGWGPGGASPIDCAIGRLGAARMGPQAGTTWHCQGDIRVDEHIDFAEAATPGDPDAGYVRDYAKTDGRRYARDSSGNEHDFTLAQWQVYPAAAGLPGEDKDLLLVHWIQGAAPLWPAAPVTASVVNSITLSAGAAGPATMDDAHARWSWTSTAAGELVTASSQVAAAQVLQMYGKTVSVWARIRINAVIRLQALYLSLNDSAGTPNVSSANVLPSMSNDTWYVAALTGVDVSSWTAPLRVVVTAVGTDQFEEVGETLFDLEWFVVAQWSK